jgi:hypothetical protein
MRFISMRAAISHEIKDNYEEVAIRRHEGSYLTDYTFVTMAEDPPTPSRIFRFLDHREFAALSQDEKIRYLNLAIEAVRRGSPIVTTSRSRAPGDGDDSQAN